MKPHVRIYLKYFDIGMEDIVQCEACGKQGRVDYGNFDIHHIYGRVGNDANNIKSLMLLCRKCHTKAHEGKLSKSELQYIHNNFLQGNRIKFIK